MEARDIAGCLDILSGSKGSQISYQSISDSDNDFVGVGDPAYYLRIVDNTNLSVIRNDNDTWLIDERTVTFLKDLSNNPLKNIQRYDIGVDTRLRKLIPANFELHEIDINISLPWNEPSIQLYITSLCDSTTRNCPYSGEQLKRNCANLHIITDSWDCKDNKKIFVHLGVLKTFKIFTSNTDISRTLTLFYIIVRTDV
ncbi:hypothetical protein GJ496_001597 [Pomphorhynchus laevis]|nr:hypothetical protein GJ496_001597 [Pomphorhynchus laevis]